MTTEAELFCTESTGLTATRRFDLFVAAMFAAELTYNYIHYALISSFRQLLSVYIEAIKASWLSASLENVKL